MYKLWPLHVIEHSSAIKGSEVLILETITVSERIQTPQKRTNSVYTKFQNMKTTLVPENRSLVSRINALNNERYDFIQLIAIVRMLFGLILIEIWSP